jgi:hypothetical protein
MSDKLESKSTQQLVNMFEDTDPLRVLADIEKRQSIMCILEKRNPRMFYEWVASPHDSPRGYFLRGKAATAKRRRTQLAPDKWESAPSTGIVPPLSLSTSQSESTPPTCG